MLMVMDQPLQQPQLQPPDTKHLKREELNTVLERATQEMYRRNMELAETNKVLSLLRTIDNLVLESHDPLKVLSHQITASIATIAEFPFVAILGLSSKASELEVYGWSTGPGVLSNLELPALEDVRISTKHQWFHSAQKGYSLDLHRIPSAKIAKYLELTTDETTKLQLSLPLQSIYLVKLTARQKLVGVMAIGFLHYDQEMTHYDKLLMDRMSEAVGVAMDNKLLFEENQRVLKQLQTTNQKLRELDQAKDEFISMASHQLRTPLTSVKGYVSMVLEGDGGKVNQDQKKLLDQAFVSSQRMVYLIADLLNVSRLRTGKFVIEPIVANLAEMIEGEVSQLTETAKQRKLELIYNKPKSFPDLMLDETKIRQVIMNFVDNAIYYTPAGGKIEINLADKGSSVEFTVKDNGIGVPKEKQHKLFSKFYRADNAKKARPDGTGLGLFMAKKVVIAQGGAIIFHSEEGKGSTFGFSFDKKKLAVPKKLPAKPVNKTTS